MVNKNTVSQVAKLLMQPQFKISLLQFFAMFPFSAAAPIVDLFIFCICFHSVWLFFPPISGSRRGRVVFFSIFTFHIL